MTVTPTGQDIKHLYRGMNYFFDLPPELDTTFS